MESRGRRYTIFVKIKDDRWVQHLSFFTLLDAETYGAALKACFPAVEDYWILDKTEEERRFG